MNMNRPLIFIPSPRNVPLFREATAHIEAEKLWVKYHAEEDAYKVARDYFLDNKRFTHLVILPDDLIITPIDFKLLKDDSYDYDVISGYCRNTIRLTPYWKGEQETESMADSNISFSLPPDPPIKGQYEDYDFIHMATIDAIRKVYEDMQSYQEPIILVRYAGFPLTFINRKTVEEVPFRRDGCCVDSCFSLDIYKKGISQYSDLRVKTVHLNVHPNEIQVGKKAAEIIFEPV